jgi:hydrogenase maturation factor
MSEMGTLMIIHIGELMNCADEENCEQNSEVGSDLMDDRKYL